ncbi:MAG: glycogen/starch synthase [Bacteroidales bacterium]|nr:glycogen/starch synthase [Bacteroidales bacterium]
MSKKRILFINQEIAPYLPAAEFSTLGRELAQGIQKRGFEVRTFMPKFGAVNERRNQLHEVIRLSGMNIIINDADHPLIIKVASMQPSRIQVYFIDNDDYFQKLDSDEDVYGSNRPDNDERAIFFARGTMETVKKLKWDPAIIHCSGWMTALGPLYLHRICNDDPVYKLTKTVYSVLPGEVTGGLNENILARMRADGIPARDLKKFKGMTPDTKLLHKIAIEYSDAVIFYEETPDPELLEIVQAREIPYITGVELKERGLDAYSDLYNKLSPK